MRIIYLHQYFSTPDMPGPTRSYEIARRLVSAGHEVHMVTSWRDPCHKTGWFETNAGEINTHWLPVPYSNYMDVRTRIKAFVRFAVGAARRASQLKGDVIYATSTPLTIAVPASFASWRADIPMVFEVRDLWPDVPIAMRVLSHRGLIRASRLLESFAYKRAAHIVTLTPTMRDFLSGKGVPLNKISVIPNAADLSRFSRDTTKTQHGAATLSNARARVVLYCGGLGPAHGPEYIVALAAEILRLNAPVMVLVAGEGRLRCQLEEMARETGCIDKTIRFIGNVPQHQVPALYNGASASIMTMHDCELLYRHSVQNKFFDSLAAGRPVFANYTGWASELAEQNGVGLILPKNDVRAAAACLIDRVTDDAWLEQAGRRARALAEQHFSWEFLATKVENVLINEIEKEKSEILNSSSV